MGRLGGGRLAYRRFSIDPKIHTDIAIFCYSFRKLRNPSGLRQDHDLLSTGPCPVLISPTTSYSPLQIQKLIRSKWRQELMSQYDGYPPKRILRRNFSPWNSYVCWKLIWYHTPNHISLPTCAAVQLSEFTAQCLIPRIRHLDIISRAIMPFLPPVADFRELCGLSLPLSLPLLAPISSFAM